MDIEKTGKMICEKRTALGMTQLMLAQKLNVSDKTVSKWERGQGLPDIAILPELAAALNISITELFDGETVTNRNRCGNLKRTLLYVCPICGNVISAVGEAVVSCCGVHLNACEVEKPEEGVGVCVQEVEDEYYITVDHPMEKAHYICFFSMCTENRIMVEKLYPEQEPAVRFPRRRNAKLYAFCNRHGLMDISESIKTAPRPKSRLPF